MCVWPKPALCKGEGWCCSACNCSNPAGEQGSSSAMSYSVLTEWGIMEQMVLKLLFLSFFALADWHVGSISVCTCFWSNECLGYQGSKHGQENPGYLSQPQALSNLKGCPLHGHSSTGSHWGLKQEEEEGHAMLCMAITKLKRTWKKSH